MPARLANATDAYVGSRLQLLRTKMDMTQQALAERLGISFQQVQKYEKGFNRISASRLEHLKQIFDVPIEFFFDGAPRLTRSVRKNKQAPSMDYVDDFLAGAEGKALAKAFLQIKDVTVRSFTCSKLWPSLEISNCLSVALAERPFGFDVRAAVLIRAAERPRLR
jgi:transcriptional regulator with XRE-family HTH domain